MKPKGENESIAIIRMVKNYIADSDKNTKIEIIQLLNDLIKDATCVRCGGSNRAGKCSSYGKSYSTHLYK